MYILSNCVDTEVMIEASSTDILLSSVSLEETDYETVAIRLPCKDFLCAFTTLNYLILKVLK